MPERPASESEQFTELAAGFEPRLVGVSRRRFLRNAAVGGIVVSFGGLAACGNNDEETFGAVDSTTQDAETTTAPETTTTEAKAEVEATDGPPGELLVSFSYAPDGSGKRENPYIAVWVETPDGELVDTIALWFEQSSKGDKWIDDLRSWYDASGRAADVTMSSATRAAGSYTVAWDLTNLNGDAVADTDLVLFVESARENGPHHITSTTISMVDRSGGALADDGELYDLSISWA